MEDGGGVEGAEPDTKRRREQRSMLKRVERHPKAALEKTDRSINLSELTGYRKMFPYSK